MATPTRHLNGLATVPAAKPLGNYPFPDPFHTSGTAALGVASYVNDFFTIGSTASDFTLTGAPTFTAVSGVGGVARITPSGAAVVATVANTAQGFQFTSGQKLWFVTRFQVSAVVAPAFIVGLQTGTGATTTDGLYFSQTAGSVISLVSKVGSTATTLVSTVVTAAAATYVDVGFYFDGTDLFVYANDAVRAHLRAPSIGATATTLTNAVIGPVFQITPTATDTMSIDYVMVAQETAR